LRTIPTGKEVDLEDALDFLAIQQGWCEDFYFSATDNFCVCLESATVNSLQQEPRKGNLDRITEVVKVNDGSVSDRSQSEISCKKGQVIWI
jgi:hypothetical protein